MNTQICTNREQSKRLLKLGVKIETADCSHVARIRDWNGNPIKSPCYTVKIGCRTDYVIQGFEEIDVIPAWSLHRLIGLLGKDRLPVSLHRKGEVSIKLNQLHPRLRGGSGYSHYDSIIDIIEYLISRNMFNEEYLEG